MLRLPARLGWLALVVVFTGAIFLSIVIFLFPSPKRLRSGHFAPRFYVAKDITYITQPIDSEGYPDYEEALNLHFSKGIIPEQNRMAAFLSAIGPKSVSFESVPERFYEWLGTPRPPDDGDYLVPLEEYLKKTESLSERKRTVIAYTFRKICESRPWKEEEYPQIVAWIRQNQRPLKAVIDASLKPQYFYPIIDADRGGELGDLRNITPFLIFGAEDLISLLSCRAMLEMGRKDYNEAKETLLTALKLIYSFQPNFTTDLRVLNQFEQQLYNRLHILIENASFSTMEMESLQGVIEAIGPFPAIAKLLDFGDRLIMLHKVLLANKNGVKNLDYLMSISHPSISKSEYDDRIEIISKTTSYNGNFSVVNKCVDELVAGLGIMDSLIRRQTIDDIEKKYVRMDDSATDILIDPYNPWISGPFSLRFNTRIIGLRVIGRSISDVIIAQQVADETEEKKRLFFTSLALAKFRRDTGSYPEGLEILVPTYLKVIPLDLYSGRIPRYGRTSEGGYQLYSIGFDQVDSGGRAQGAGKFSDDIVINVPLPPSR